MLAVVLVLLGCEQKPEYNKKEFVLVSQQANIFMVYISGSMAKGRSKNVFASQDLCDSKGMVDCEVYAWKEREKIPKKLPMTNENMPFYGHYSRDKFGREVYKCSQCYDTER